PLPESSAPRPFNFADVTQQLLLADYAPAAVLINRKNEVLYYYGPTAKYLEAPTGEPTQDINLLVREGLRTKLRAAIHKTVRGGGEGGAEAHGRRNGGVVSVRATVKAITHPRAAEGLLLLTFEDLPEPAVPPASRDPIHEESALRQLEYELNATREDLQ